MTKVLQLSKNNCNNVLGKFASPSDYDSLIFEDTDAYDFHPFDSKKMDEDNVILKFRKNVFTKEEQRLAYEALNKAAASSKNRGISAGPRGDKLYVSSEGYMDFVSAKEWNILENLLDDSSKLSEESLQDVIDKPVLEDEFETRGRLWLKTKIREDGYDYNNWWDSWLNKLSNLSSTERKKKAEYVIKTYVSSTVYAQNVLSGIAGFYGRYTRIPYKRATSYTEENWELFQKCFPYINKLDETFRKELPNRWKNQKNCAEKIDSRFVVNNTSITTLTVNRNFRTAYHKDAGDLEKGFSNISTLTNGNGWEGGYLVLPEYRIAIDVRPGDLLFVANHTAIHGNTEILGKDPDRVSVVAYFREDLLEIGSYEYESARKEFIENRRKNESHPLWKPYWNGVSPKWDTSDEWYEFLKSKNIEDPYKKEETSLEEFF